LHYAGVDPGKGFSLDMVSQDRYAFVGLGYGGGAQDAQGHGFGVVVQEGNSGLDRGDRDHKGRTVITFCGPPQQFQDQGETQTQTRHLSPMTGQRAIGLVSGMDLTPNGEQISGKVLEANHPRNQTTRAVWNRCEGIQAP